MSEVALIINAGDIEHTHSNGLCGTFIIPRKPPGMSFGLLVVYPVPEIKDLGERQVKVDWVKARGLARDIVGIGSDAPRARLGVLLCEAEPDLPKPLIKALEAEMLYLNENRPEIRHKRKGNIVQSFNVEDPEVKAEKVRLSAVIVKERDKFHEYCRTLVTPEEVSKASAAVSGEYGRLVAEADFMWGQPGERVNISELHRLACRTLGQERPWCYTPQQLVACPGCGVMIKEGVITCGHCGAIIDEPMAAYTTMTPKEKATKLYPERYAPGEEAPHARPGSQRLYQR